MCRVEFVDSLPHLLQASFIWQSYWALSKVYSDYTFKQKKTCLWLTIKASKQFAVMTGWRITFGQGSKRSNWANNCSNPNSRRPIDVSVPGACTKPPKWCFLFVVCQKLWHHYKPNLKKTVHLQTFNISTPLNQALLKNAAILSLYKSFVARQFMFYSVLYKFLIIKNS